MINCSFEQFVWIPLSRAENYCLYQDREGNIYFTTLDSAACLTKPGESFTLSHSVAREVRKLEKGFTITLTQGD